MQKILIVEDDIDIQDILKNHLTDAGYEVVIADDGVDGIAKFDETICLVLLDIMLQKMQVMCLLCLVTNILFMCRVIPCPSIRQHKRFGRRFLLLYQEYF